MSSDNPRDTTLEKEDDSDNGYNTSLPQQRFSPEEEAALLEESNTQKIQANKLFSTARYSEAIGEYDKALASCPNYLEYEIAVLKSNISACHLQLEDWKAAIEAATASLEALDRLEPKKPTKAKKEDAEEGGAVVEIEGDDEEAERALAELKMSDERREDSMRIRAKSLLRRAKAKVELGGWGNLAGAEEDYKELSKMSSLPPRDQKTVQKALGTLPAQVNAAKDIEMGEMIGKLKELGNGILRPFGLSTDMFKMTKDPQTGSYSMSMGN